MTAPVARVGARMVVLDPLDRVLLIEEAGDEPGNSWQHWLTPGGGVEPGEALTDAATREVVEETGMRIVLAADQQPVFVQQRRWSWDGTTYDQRDHIFGARVSAPFDVVPTGLTAMELETVKGARWWTSADLRASSDTFIPSDIADLVDLIASDPSVVRPQARFAGRMLLIDAEGCVLLIETHPSVGSSERHWIAPGGGVEAGEDAVGAAVRELAEETGVRADLVDLEPIAVERAVFRFADDLYDQTDTYFLARVSERPDVDDSRSSAQERELTTAYRWWSAVELRTTAETVWPVGLADVLDRLNGVSARA